MSHTTKLELISTCPESHRIAPPDYLGRVQETARWCESAGHSAIVVHSDHRLVDPWVVAQAILATTDRLRPIVTVQPLYMHPYAVAKKVVSLARLYGRTPDLNLVAGGFKGDLLALDDDSDHDSRYRRVAEYGAIIRRLLTESEPVVHDGEFYRLYMPTTLTPLAAAKDARFFVAGSSAAGRTTARALGAHTVGHPLSDDDTADCVRLGVVARGQCQEAWATARSQFGVDPEARMRRRLEMCWSDSNWQSDLAQASSEREHDSAWWLQPFESRRAQCAYLVGDYRAVAREIVALLERGVKRFMLDTPASEDELGHTANVFERAWGRYVSPLALTG